MRKGYENPQFVAKLDRSGSNLGPTTWDGRLRWEPSGGAEPSACTICGNSGQLVSELNSGTLCCIQRAKECIIVEKLLHPPNLVSGSVEQKEAAVHVSSSQATAVGEELCGKNRED